MIIPNEVMIAFKKEVESTNYGKVSLGIIRRGNHEHYEIDKHITMKDNGEMVDSSQEETNISPKMGADEGRESVYNKNNNNGKP